MWRWLERRRLARAAVRAAADELLSRHGEQRAHHVAVEYARATRDGRLFEEGRDAHFWWKVVLEVDRRADRPRLDTATRYLEDP